MPQKLYEIIGPQSLSVPAIHRILANKNTAQFSDINSTLIQLVKEGEFVLLGKHGREKDRKRVKTIRASDSIILPSTIVLPGISRIDQSKKIPTV